MAKIERLNKRVKKIEEWIAENEDMGGPKGYLDTMVSLYQDAATKLAKKFQKKTPKGTKLPNKVNNRSYRRKAKGGAKKKVQRYKRK